MKNYPVIIVGGGTAGIMVAAQLKRAQPDLGIALIDKAEKHWYQPAWTLVGAGTFDMQKTWKPQADFIPDGVDWIKQYVQSLEPDQNQVVLEDGSRLEYEQLVVCPGIQLRPDLLPGLEEGLASGKVVSNYIDPESTWKALQSFKGGQAVFTQPATPIKCGGAPQKILYLADSYFRKSGVRDKTNVVFATPGSVIFGVKEFAKTLNEVIRKKDITVKYYYEPVRIDAEKQEIHFRYTKAGDNDCVLTEDQQLRERIEGEASIVMPYDLLHLAPPQSAPEFIRNSVLAGNEAPAKGWLEVDIHTMQHKRYPNVFGLGDAAGLPTAKTGAAIRKQAPVVVANLLAYRKNKGLSSKTYQGYSSCPLVTDYGKMVLAEFKYNNVRDSDPLLSKMVDTTKEQYSMWLLKKYALPWLYWNKMLKGKM